jgi:hypothetical protein
MLFGRGYDLDLQVQNHGGRGDMDAFAVHVDHGNIEDY